MLPAKALLVVASFLAVVNATPVTGPDIVRKLSSITIKRTNKALTATILQRYTHLEEKRDARFGDPRK